MSLMRPLFRPLFRPMMRPLFPGESWTPLSLFANNEQGAWYDPSDLSTLYQDSAGTTPVTANGDPVGLMLDKSGNGNHATQSVAASRPIYRTDGTLHWLEPDGVDDKMTTSAFSLGDETSLFSVAVRKVARNAGAVYDYGNYAVEGALLGLGSFSAGLDFSAVRLTNATSLNSGENVFPETAVWSSALDSITYRLYKNGTELSSTPNIASGTFRNHPLTLFDRVIGGTLFSGQFFGMLVLSRAPNNTAELESLEAYLAQKAGVTL